MRGPAFTQISLIRLWISRVLFLLQVSSIHTFMRPALVCGWWDSTYLMPVMPRMSSTRSPHMRAKEPRGSSMGTAGTKRCGQTRVCHAVTRSIWRPGASTSTCLGSMSTRHWCPHRSSIDAPTSTASRAFPHTVPSRSGRTTSFASTPSSRYRPRTAETHNWRRCPWRHRRASWLCTRWVGQRLGERRIYGPSSR